MRRILMLAGALFFAVALYGDGAVYGYDNAGRLVSIAYANGTVVNYTYDSVGNVTSRSVVAAGNSSSQHKTRSKKRVKGYAHTNRGAAER